MKKAPHKNLPKNFSISSNELYDLMQDNSYAWHLFSHLLRNSPTHLEKKRKEDLMKDLKWGKKKWGQAIKILIQLKIIKIITISDGKTIGKDYEFHNVPYEEIEVEKEIEFPIEKEKPRLIIPGIENIPSVPPSYLNNEKEEELPF